MPEDGLDLEGVSADVDGVIEVLDARERLGPGALANVSLEKLVFTLGSR